jgi:HEAT repeat protein
MNTLDRFMFCSALGIAVVAHHAPVRSAPQDAGAHGAPSYEAHTPAVVYIPQPLVPKEETESWTDEVFLGFLGLCFAAISGFVAFKFHMVDSARKAALKDLTEVREQVAELKDVMAHFDGFRAKAAQLDELWDKVEVIGFRAQLTSSDPLQRRLAVEKASNHASHLVIPLLKDTLRDHLESPIQCEALFGLARHRAIVSIDPDAIDLIRKASRHSCPNVRNQAIECMATVDPEGRLFPARLEDMLEIDTDEAVKAKARHALMRRGQRT